MPLSEQQRKQLIRQVAKKHLRKLKAPHKASEFFATDGAMMKHFNDRNAEQKAQIYGRVMMCSDLERDRRIKRFHKALGDAYRKGLSFEDARADLMKISANADSHALKTVFTTNMRSAYNAARYEAQMMSSKEYLRYVSAGDSRVRDEHEAWHGLILPKDDAFWDSHYPPNGFNCRCKVQAVSESEIERNGYQVAKRAPATPPPPAGFRNAPIKGDGAMVQVFAQRVRELDKSSAPFLAPAREQSIKSKLALKLEAAQKSTLECKKLVGKFEQILQSEKAYYKKILGDGVELKDAKERIKKIAASRASNMDKERRRLGQILLGKFDGKSVFVTSDAVGAHLYHEDMGAAEWAFLPHALKTARIKSRNKKIVKKVYFMGDAFELVLKYVYNQDAYMVSTFHRANH